MTADLEVDAMEMRYELTTNGYTLKDVRPIFKRLREALNFEAAARAVIKRFWLPDFYGEFPEERSTLELVEWMAVGNGKSHSSLRIANASAQRRGERITQLQSQLAEAKFVIDHGASETELEALLKPKNEAERHKRMVSLIGEVVSLRQRLQDAEAKLPELYRAELTRTKYVAKLERLVNGTRRLAALWRQNHHVGWQDEWGIVAALDDLDGTVNGV